jgi:protein involved in polysaccharide export with SLBB domain
MRVTDVIPSFESLLPGSYFESAEILRIVKPDFHKETLSFNLQKALSGDARENVALQEQDSIKVFSRWDMEEKPIVSINGFVVNPGTYDYFPHMTVRDLVTAAGSPKRNAFLDNAEMTRIVVANGKAQATRLDIDLRKALGGDPKQNLELQPDDVLIVRGIVEWLESTDRFVTLKGEVRFPGIYSITKGERLSSVIRRAGGFTERSYLNGVKFTRKSVQKDQQKRMDEIIQREEQEIMKRQGELAAVAASREELEATKSALEGLQKSLEKLKTAKAEGRVVIRLARLEEFENGPFDMELQGGDALEIPQTPNVVNILGQVYNQTTLIHQPGENVGFYLKKAGGPTRSAEVDEMYVVRADGTVFSRQQSSFGVRWDDTSHSWTFGSFMSAPLQPGDTLVVPQKLERVAWLRDIKDITQILANVALSAGTLILGFK